MNMKRQINKLLLLILIVLTSCDSGSLNSASFDSGLNVNLNYTIQNENRVNIPSKTLIVKDWYYLTLEWRFINSDILENNINYSVEIDFGDYSLDLTNQFVQSEYNLDPFGRHYYKGNFTLVKSSTVRPKLTFKIRKETLISTTNVNEIKVSINSTEINDKTTMSLNGEKTQTLLISLPIFKNSFEEPASHIIKDSEDGEKLITIKVPQFTSHYFVKAYHDSDLDGLIFNDFVSVDLEKSLEKTYTLSEINRVSGFDYLYFVVEILETENFLKPKLYRFQIGLKNRDLKTNVSVKKIPEISYELNLNSSLDLYFNIYLYIDDRYLLVNSVPQLVSKTIMSNDTVSVSNAEIISKISKFIDSNIENLGNHEEILLYQKNKNYKATIVFLVLESAEFKEFKYDTLEISYSKVKNYEPIIDYSDIPEILNISFSKLQTLREISIKKSNGDIIIRIKENISFDSNQINVSQLISEHGEIILRLEFAENDLFQEDIFEYTVNSESKGE
jgi:hypothetical protein